MEENKNDISDLLTRISQNPPYDRLDDAQRKQLFAAAERRQLEVGTVVQHPEQADYRYLFIVLKGVVRLTDVETQRLVDVCSVGSSFGSEGLLSDRLTYEARVAEAAECLAVPAETFHQITTENPTFLAFFQGDLGRFWREKKLDADGDHTALTFGVRLGDLLRRGPVSCPVDTTAREAARIMRDEHVGSILITEGDQAVGIMTDTDLRNKIVAEGQPLTTPVRKLMNAPLIGIESDAPLIKAVMKLAKHNIHHLVVFEKPGQSKMPLGVISDLDLAQSFSHDPLVTVKRLEKTTHIEDLANLRQHFLHSLAATRQQGVSTADLLDLNTEVNDQLVTRLLYLIEESLKAEHPDQYVDIPWAWIALGSEGRREMGLSTDQDNGLIYANPTSDAEAEKAEAWFKMFAETVNDALARCGFKLCKGDVMARNPKWRQPLKNWKDIFRKWILAPEPMALMHASIFFDLRCLYGDCHLVDELKADLVKSLQEGRGFLPFLMHNSLSNKPPLSFFGRLVLERSGEHRHTFDIKLRGLMPVVDMARILCLELHYLDTTNTIDRLQYVIDHQSDIAQTTASILEAYQFLTEIRLTHHFKMLEAGESPNNHIDPSNLNRTQQNILKVVFSAIDDAQKSLSRRFGADMMR